ncbi:hypothetical protein [Arthrobacter mobilis]|uniref:Uncharacterized protein n=1 Tax=Arthrobacter mobilis TaxID=2724944 RepID=A0A7X6K6Y5_9MICC|nr:hypothetical protein [Arthrobacter mobilis]NKX55928.1 hypothetical protein [Arthrobacter mobilis]
MPNDDVPRTNEPQYYLSDGTPQFDELARKDEVYKNSFNPLPSRDLKKGTVVELSIGRYAVLPDGFSQDKHALPYALKMRLIGKNRRIAKTQGLKCCWWYGGVVRVVWEPNEDIREEEIPVLFTRDGLPVRAAVENEFLKQDHGAPALVGGAL